MPARDGVTWSATEDDTLRDEFMRGHTLAQIAIARERTENAIFLRLQKLGSLTYGISLSEAQATVGFCGSLKCPAPVPNLPTKETVMKIETCTMLNGRRITEYSKEQLYEVINTEHARIQKLEAMYLPVMPDCLKKDITDSYAVLADLVHWMNTNL